VCLDGLTSLIVVGNEINDIFSAQEGGESYSKDLPDSETQRHSSGHFPVEVVLMRSLLKSKDSILREKKPT
jgi:hypothetical protein